MTKFNQLNSEYNRYLAATFTDKQLEGAIFGILKHANVLPGHPHRDDLIQECRLTVAQAMVDYDQLFQPKINRFAFVYQRLRWQITNFFNREERLRQHQGLVLDGPTPIEEIDHPALQYNFDFESRTDSKKLLQRLYQICEPKQKAYLDLLIKDPELTNPEIANLLGITPRAANYRRKKIQEVANQMIIKHA